MKCGGVQTVWPERRGLAKDALVPKTGQLNTRKRQRNSREGLLLLLQCARLRPSLDVAEGWRYPGAHRKEEGDDNLKGPSMRTRSPAHFTHFATQHHGGERRPIRAAAIARRRSRTAEKGDCKTSSANLRGPRCRSQTACSDLVPLAQAAR